LRNVQTPVPHATAIIAGCVLAAACEGFDLQAAGVAAGGLIPEFKPSADQLGTFFSASTLGLCAGALVGGRLSDSFGRGRILIASVFLFGCFSILTATSWDIQSLSWWRLLTGAGLGGAFPNLLALVNESSAAHRRRANVALVYGSMPFGGAFASLSSMLMAPAHWRLIFFAGGVAPLLLFVVLLRLAHKSPDFVSIPHHAPRADPTFSSQTETGSRAGSFIAIFADGRALPTVLLWISSFLGLVLLYLLVSWLPTLLVGYGLSKPQAAGAQIAFNVGGGFAALAMGQLVESRLRNPAVVVTFVALPLFVLLLSRGSAQLVTVVGIVFALGCAVLAALGYLYATAPEVYPTPIRGVGTGVAVAMGRLGSIVGPKLGGTLKAAGHSSSQVLTDVLPLVILGSLAALAFAWSTSRERHATAQAHAHDA